MTSEFKAIADAVNEAIDRVREGRVERTVLKSEGPRGYSEAVPRESLPPSDSQSEKSSK